MDDLIIKDASFYKLCRALTPMEKLAEEPRVPNFNSGNTPTDIAAADVNNIASVPKQAPDVIGANPPAPNRTYTEKADQE